MAFTILILKGEGKGEEQRAEGMEHGAWGMGHGAIGMLRSALSQPSAILRLAHPILILLSISSSATVEQGA